MPQEVMSAVLNKVLLGQVPLAEAISVRFSLDVQRSSDRMCEKRTKKKTTNLVIIAEYMNTWLLDITIYINYVKIKAIY